MDRRKFLGNTALFSVPLMLKGIPVFAGDGVLHPMLQALAAPTANCDRILVVIQMNGGNDGLNMVVPLDRYTELSNARASILLPSASVLPLNGTTTTGLHPAMTGLRDLYNQGKVNLVQGVSYPNPNFSHFQAQDIWFTGQSTLPSPDTGWLGRQLDVANPGFPIGYPNPTNTDPLAIQIGGALPLSLQGPNINMGYNAPNPASLINVATGNPGAAPVSDYGTELTFLRLMKDQSNAYTLRITTAYNAQATQSTMYPASGNTLADQLKIVARLIGGGLKTPVYIVNHPDTFDTHVDQVVAGNTTTGFHANILSKLSVAISAFQNDITLMGKADKVTGMTFSEFGRRVISNTSSGTDHGSGAPVIFFGNKLIGAVTGTSPVLPTNPTGSTQVPLQYDYRQLYATVMQKWLCMTPAESQTILNGTYGIVPIFNEALLPLDGMELKAAWEGAFAKLEFEVYENDSYDSFTIERSVNGTSYTPVHTITNVSSNNQQKYVYKDDRIYTAQVYYRVKGISKQGAASYSKIAVLRNGSRQEVRVYPNPVTNFTINIEFLTAVNEHVEITLFGPMGEKLYYNQLHPRGNRAISFKVPDYFAVRTMYILNISFSGTVVNEKILFE
ncbi:MAG TPA: DUF1501 domain-containing protein [Ferruginibacter sp.]|nr:DUF1501 domain-containing protein [Ferruginibacter sp.]